VKANILSAQYLLLANPASVGRAKLNSAGVGRDTYPLIKDMHSFQMDVCNMYLGPMMDLRDFRLVCT